MSIISASIGTSLSRIFILSPILNGNEKKIIIPAVILLKIDHWANIATPITVKIEEITKNACFRSTPQTGTKVRIIKILIRKSMYFKTSLILGFEKPDFFPNLPTKVEITNLISKEKSSTTAVATISRWYELKKTLSSTSISQKDILKLIF